MKQQLVIYKHEEYKLIYVGVYNSNKNLKNSSSINTNYNRAKYLHSQMLKNEDARGLKSGFMMALINSDYSGWTMEILDEVYENSADAAYAKQDYVQSIPDTYTFVGSEKLYIKGIAKEFGVNSSWTKKWNLNHMTQKKIRQKVEFIVKSMAEDVPDSIYREAYLCTILPDGVKIRTNYGDYEINDLISLFKFVRNYMGYDL